MRYFALAGSLLNQLQGPQGRDSRRSLLRITGASLLFSLVYFLTAKLGLLLAIAPGSASPVWPPSGLAVAVLFLFGRRLWPGIFIGEIAAVISDGLSWPVALGMGCGNVAEALIAVSLLNKFRRPDAPILHHSRELSLLLAGGFAGSAVAASTGVSSLFLGQILPAAAMGQAWFTWLLGDFVGIIVVTPLILTWTARQADPRKLRFNEAVIIGMFAMLLALIIFSGVLPTAANDYPLVFALLPILVFAAFRTQQRLLTLFTGTLAVVAIIGTAKGLGPFAHADLNAAMMLLQGYIGIIAGTALFLSAVLVENTKVAHALRSQQDHLEASILDATTALKTANEHIGLLLESTDQGIYAVNADGRCTLVNQAGAKMTGYSAAELIGSDMHQLLHAQDEHSNHRQFEDSLIWKTLAEGLVAGADDDVVWRKDGTHFPVSYTSSPMLKDGEITGAVVIFRDTTQERAMAQRMDFLASHDALTGLFNRAVFERHLARAIESAREEGRQHTLCYLDLDQFKVVNDTCGHFAGDELLRQLSQLFSHRIRRSDILARLGGDEFGLLFDSCSPQEAAKHIDGFLELMRDFRFNWEGKSFAIGMSIGVMEISPETPSLSIAMSGADAACYMAKELGRNRAHVFREEDTEMAKRHSEMQWVSRLNAALDEDRLYVEGQIIQPLDDSNDGLFVEVLVRLRDETSDKIPPGAFIPAAERYNLMSKVDRWVTQHVFEWLNQNPHAADQLALCTINLSGQSVSSEAFLKELLSMTETLKVPTEKICFELTETAAIANLSHAAKLIHSLKKRGYRIALDDFGSGMSSFAYLKNLPIDFLKIDGNFVRDIVNDEVDHAMVSAINDVGHVLGLKTIAEFVESQDILDALKALKVDFAQGFFLRAPVALDELLQPA